MITCRGRKPRKNAEGHANAEPYYYFTMRFRIRVGSPIFENHGRRLRGAGSVGRIQADARTPSLAKAPTSLFYKNPNARGTAGGVDHRQRRITGAIRFPLAGPAAGQLAERLAVGEPAEWRATALQLQD
jgi:hypothetical protein